MLLYIISLPLRDLISPSLRLCPQLQTTSRNRAGAIAYGVVGAFCRSRYSDV
jgi:hypothetical protein